MSEQARRKEEAWRAAQRGRRRTANGQKATPAPATKMMLPKSARTFKAVVDPRAPATLALAMAEAKRTGTLRIPPRACYGPGGKTSVKLGK